MQLSWTIYWITWPRIINQWNQCRCFSVALVRGKSMRYKCKLPSNWKWTLRSNAGCRPPNCHLDRSLIQAWLLEVLINWLTSLELEEENSRHQRCLRKTVSNELVRRKLMYHSLLSKWTPHLYNSYTSCIQLMKASLLRSLQHLWPFSPPQHHSSPSRRQSSIPC